MTKKLLKLMHAFIDTNNPKRELNFALVDFDDRIIVATDSRRIIKVNIPHDNIQNCHGKHLVHKKIISAMEKLADKDGDYSFQNNNIVIDGNKVSIDAYLHEFHYPDHDRIFGVKTDDSFTLDHLNQIDFELTHLNCHINNSYIVPLKAYGAESGFSVWYRSQTIDNAGIVRIQHNDENHIVFDAIIMGEEFKPQYVNLFNYNKAV